jgi:subtilisin family serine protease
MKKLFVATISAVLLAVSISPAKAEVIKTIAVIDTGIDITHPALNGKIVHEVCILDFALCPNGKKFMEGVGAATLDPAKASKNTFYHGTQMSSIIVQNNPDAKIIFIRVVAMTSSGAKASVSTNAIGNALKWVSENKDKYGIAVVSTSMGLKSTSGCATNKLVEDNIVSLSNSGVATVFSTGNGYTYNQVDFPACVPQSIAVGGADYVSKKYYPALYSNNSINTDFFALGKLSAAQPGGKYSIVIGTSAASALLSSKWLMYSQQGLSYDEIYEKIKSLSVVTSTKNVSNALMFDHNSVG